MGKVRSPSSCFFRKHHVKITFITTPALSDPYFVKGNTVSCLKGQQFASLLITYHSSTLHRWRSKQRMPVGGSLGLKLILPKHARIIAKVNVLLLFVLCRWDSWWIMFNFNETLLQCLIPLKER